VTCHSFSLAHHLETLNLFKDSGYHIGPVSDYFNKKIYDKHILLRHDIDLSLDYALDMALLEKDNDIQSTYYILLHSDLYNAASPEGIERIRAIKAAGHDIGLHIDTRHFLGPIEFEILAQIAQCNITSWCRHLVNVTPTLDIAYDASTIPYKYVSDSAMRYREGCFCNHVNKHDKLQILRHPEWVMVDPTGKLDKYQIMQRLEEEAKGRTAKSFLDFRDLVRTTGELIASVV